MEFRVLGPTDVSCAGRAIELGSAKQRTLLAALVLEAGRVVPVDRLVDTLWETDPPRTAGSLVQGYVSRLRRSLGGALGGGEDAVIETRPAGYLLRADPAAVDWLRFEGLVRQGREELAAGQPEAAAASLRSALALWRGPALADVDSAVLLRTAGARLEELRLTALEERIEADLLLGRHEQMVAELRELVGVAPTRDRLVGQLMVALYRCGRQAEALDRYRAARAARLDQLGLDPSQLLERLQQQVLRGDPALDPPPVAAPVPRRGPVGRLPRARDRFIGRGRDLAAIDAALREQPLVTLAGGPGVGKTRLALELAGRVAERYPDGVWLVPLATVTDGPLVAQTVTRTLGIREDQGRTPADILVDWLQPRRALLVLDNCEHLVADCAELIDIVLEQCEGVSILATSREPLAVTGERVHPVSPLDLPRGADADTASVRSAEAVQLFETRAASVRPEFAVTDANAAAVAGVCRSLDGTPLAIELAAARLRVLTIEQIADRLDHQLELLSEESAARPGTPARGRRRTLRAAFDWSHNLLSDPERAVFARLSVFAGGFNLAAAEVIAAGGPVTGPLVLRLLETLMEKSLVVGETGTGAAAGEMRFRLLEATRQYACERLSALGEDDAVRRRHADFFLDLAVRADADRRGPHRVELGLRLTAEYDNITAALLWARQAGEHRISLMLAAAMGWYWARRPREGLSWVRAALAAGRDADPRHQQWALWAAAHLSAHSAPAEALQFSRRSVELALETGDTRSAVYPLLIHGRLVEERGEPDRAARLHDQAVAYAEAAGDTFGTATALRSRGLSRAHAGEYANAERDVTRAAALFAELGDQVGAMEAQLNLARLALLRDQAALAERLIRDLLPQLQALVPDEFDTATAHRYLAWIAARSGRWDTVHTELARSLPLAFRLNAARIVAFDLVLAATAADARGMPRRAAVILGAVDTHLHKRAAPLRTAERTERDHLEAALRDQLGEMRLLLLWERGAAIPIRNAVEFALDPTADIPDGDWDSVRIDAPLLPFSD